MSKSKLDPLAKRAGETHQQWQMRIAMAGLVNDEDKDRNKPNVFALQHGDYRNRFVTHVEDGTKTKTHVNRGGTPICRWEAAGKLDETHLIAIAYCQRLWLLSGLKVNVTANYGERIAGMGCAEIRAVNEIEARDDLKRIEGYFPGRLRDYFGIFENVVRHAVPAGVAGGDDGEVSKANAARALNTVRFVSDVIATRERL